MNEQAANHHNLTGRALVWTLRGLGALPLLAYPLVLPASLMLLGTPDPNSPPALLLLLKNAFGWGSVLYPLAYFGGLVLAGRAAGRGAAGGQLAWSALPLVYLLALAVLFRVWGVLEQP